MKKKLIKKSSSKNSPSKKKIVKKVTSKKKPMKKSQSEKKPLKKRTVKKTAIKKKTILQKKTKMKAPAKKVSSSINPNKKISNMKYPSKVVQETIETIASKIHRHRELELTEAINNHSIGRAYVDFNGENQQIWLINELNQSGSSYLRDINNNITGVIEGTKKAYENDGLTTYKNTKVGEALIRFREGKHKLTVPKGIVYIEIFNKASYTPTNSKENLASDIIIKLSGNDKYYSYKTLIAVLRLQKEIDLEKESLEKATEKEAVILRTSILKKEEEKRNLVDKAQSFIRRYAQLRYQPILDPSQESIKRSKIFDGTLIINGGPGTGKTTSLIQRIKFLTSSSIKEYYTLSLSQEAILFSDISSWIFFSPNELLALYLRNSMVAEGLKSNSTSVRVWSAHKHELIRRYRLVTELKRPFIYYNNNSSTPLFSNDPKSISLVVDGYFKHLIKHHQDKINKLIHFDVTRFEWKDVGLAIQAHIADDKSIEGLSDLVSIFIGLERNFLERSKLISQHYHDEINIFASRFIIEIKKETGKYDRIAEVIRQQKIEAAEQDDGETDEEELEEEAFQEIAQNTAYDIEEQIFSRIKSISRKIGLSNYDKNIRLSKNDWEFVEVVPEIMDRPELDKVGNLAMYKKYFENITKGIEANVLRELPYVYKKYRHSEYKIQSSNWNLGVLGILISNDKNSRIHPDEQALLLLIINTVASSLYKDFHSQFERINHPYITAFNNNTKAVIAIDEATDFSLIDIYAMNSLRHPEISSVTLAGDVMQRMTHEGIQSWKSVSDGVDNCEIKDLIVSYRQSPSLLNIAKSIYEKATNETANYESFLLKDDLEPKPLVYFSRDEDEKLSWIASRIHEIYKAYGDSIPSIAIFLPHEDKLEDIAKKLGQMDSLADIGILVKACKNGEVLGDANTVRIFSIEVIKGLEFESVFFHNFDDVIADNDENQSVLRYLYVGLSRATFYIGLTMSEQFNAKLSFMTEHFNQSKKSWML